MPAARHAGDRRQPSRRSSSSAGSTKAGSKAATRRSSTRSLCTTATTASRPSGSATGSSSSARRPTSEHGEIEWYDPDPTELTDKRREVAAEIAELVEALVSDPEFDPEAPLAEGEDPAEREANTKRWMLAQLLELPPTRGEARVVGVAIERMNSEIEVLRSDAECVGGPRSQIRTDPPSPTRSRCSTTSASTSRRRRCAPAKTSRTQRRETRPARCLRSTLRRAPSRSAADRRSQTPRCPNRSCPAGRSGPTSSRRRSGASPQTCSRTGSTTGSGSPRAATSWRAGRRGSTASARARPSTTAHRRSTSLRKLVADMDSTCLVIQGPPGSGKTYTGARLVTQLIDDGCRVGVTVDEPQGDPQLPRRDREGSGRGRDRVQGPKEGERTTTRSPCTSPTT